MNVRVHIERLVLDGIDVPYGERGALRASLERELARQLLANGVAPEWASGIAIPSVSAPSIEATANAPALGIAIANAVASGIGGRR
jgi:hypothetical protein